MIKIVTTTNAMLNWFSTAHRLHFYPFLIWTPEYASWRTNEQLLHLCVIISSRSLFLPPVPLRGLLFNNSLCPFPVPELVPRTTGFHGSLLPHTLCSNYFHQIRNKLPGWKLTPEKGPVWEVALFTYNWTIGWKHGCSQNALRLHKLQYLSRLTYSATY